MIFSAFLSLCMVAHRQESKTTPFGSDNLTTTVSRSQPVRCRKRRRLERFESTAEEPITVMTADCLYSGLRVASGVRRDSSWGAFLEIPSPLNRVRGILVVPVRSKASRTSAPKTVKVRPDSC